MLIIPAIDLKHGKVVRLTQGDPSRTTVYADDPIALAKAWEAGGAPRLHVVDLDGAFAGEPRQLALIGEIARAVKVPIQAGGGLRSLEAVEAAFQAGVAIVVLGTGAIVDRTFLEEVIARHPRRVILALDAKGGRLAIKGWQETLNHSAWETVEQVAFMELAAILYTDVLRDGTMEGPNFDGLLEMATRSRHPILASGGISSLEDIRRLGEIKGVAGAILGKALYSGAVKFGAALKVAAEARVKRC
jgi:phosphoribosylformimino-5-aminoimidazole carboxamide ribotide isomerase